MSSEVTTDKADSVRKNPQWQRRTFERAGKVAANLADLGARVPGKVHFAVDGVNCTLEVTHDDIVEIEAVADRQRDPVTWSVRLPHWALRDLNQRVFAAQAA